jgi:hypothetical protein
VGIRPELAILESFLYPRVSPFGRGDTQGGEVSGMQRIKKIAGDFFAKPTEWVAPPDAYLVYGVRWWRGSITAAPVTETRHDSILNPTQATIRISLAVKEFGSIHRLMTSQRQFFALLGTAETALTTLSPDNIGEVVQSFGRAFGR